MRTSIPTVAARRGSCSFYPYHLHTHGNTGAGHGSLLSSGPPRATWGTLKTNRPHHPDRAPPRLAPEGRKSPQARRERLRPAAGARQLSCSPRRGFVLEICCWQIPLGTGISHQQLHGGDVSVCARQG